MSCNNSRRLSRRQKCQTKSSGNKVEMGGGGCNDSSPRVSHFDRQASLETCIVMETDFGAADRGWGAFYCLTIKMSR